ncbi:VanZ family protein [Paenibacillus tianjinensis]|uniref:VanZ family protein n=1 Tax=Paenibacillus tianjinensis TaxID=2810347 RepID=A0ABX7LHJ1_9BACL|nr:VanZ family protein [Paenibacillus tianjinensis]QSF45392.1 VanZ family protein [Paenibacillus tianjinensis]
MDTKQRKIILAITLAYTVFILYFMFFGLGRTDTLDRETGHTFLFLPDGFFKLPSLSDLLHPTLMDIVGFGNIVAFIPFGILILLLYRVGFLRFMILFILSILVLETVQALTLLGSFDMNDVIQNASGAAIGFGAYRLGYRTEKIWTNIAATGISVVLLIIGVWGIFEVVDKALTKELGPFVALNELKSSSINSPSGTMRDSFQLGGQNVEPQYNAYSTEDKNMVTYTYTLDKKELYLYLNYGIPDQEDSHGSLRISADGQEYLSTSAEAQSHEIGMTSVYIQGANELTITLEGDVKIWDVGFREMKYDWNW